MPIFKPKPSKQIQVSAKASTTLDSKHSVICDSFVDDDHAIAELRKEKKMLRSRVRAETDLALRLDLEDRITQISKDIATRKSRRKNYYLDNSRLVFDYFEQKKGIAGTTITSDGSENGVSAEEPSAGSRSLRSFFKLKQEDAAPQEDRAQESGASLVQQYLANVDETFLDMGNFVVPSDICKSCHEGELIPVEHEGILVCNRCSAHVPMLIENEKPSYKEPPKEVCFYAYKRINHFREILAQFQAKETTQIPPEVLDHIRRQIQKERIEVSTITNRKAKEILKKLGYNKYYEHIPFIKDKLGVKPPIMSPELEETLCSLFMDIQGPYAKYCPENRVNFLNYYYTVYKLCELLDQRQFLPYFPMLKDMGKRIEQDAIWKKICGDLEWEFIPTL